MDIRRYFTREFYKDHIQRYKKRPIYWMFSSPKGSFNVLIYMHRYTPDTLNQILNGYLREYRLEQVLRDARITSIYEGANGIHERMLATRLLNGAAGDA